MKITSLVVKPHDFDQPITDNALSINAEEFDSEGIKPYVVDLIDDEGRYFYRSDCTTIEITKDEFEGVLQETYKNIDSFYLEELKKGYIKQLDTDL